jgi:replicative DNA helicase
MNKNEYQMENKKSETTKTSATLRSLYEDNIRYKTIMRDGKPILTGLKAYDDIFSAFIPGEFVVVAGRPGMGKLTLLSSMAINIAKHHRVAFFTFNANADQLSRRILSSITAIPYDSLLRNTMTNTERRYLDIFEDQLANQLFIHEGEPGDLESLRQQCLQYIKGENCRVVCVDSLQMMNLIRNGGKNATVADICELLRDLAKQHEVVFIVSSVLNQRLELRAGWHRRPMITDLAERGTIELLADKVIFLYRGEYYGLTEDEDGNSTKNLAELTIAKNNFGSVGTIYLFYNPKICNIRDYYVSGDWKDEGILKKFKG